MSVEIIIKGFYQAFPDALFDQALQLRAVDGAGNTSKSSRIEEGDVYHPKRPALKSLIAGDARIKIDRICADARVLESTESSRLIPCLRHRVQITSEPTGAVWTDRIMIDAGALTPIIARYIMQIHQKQHTQRGAMLVEVLLAKSYRPAQVGLPMFQTLDRPHASRASGLSRAGHKLSRADTPKTFARATVFSR